MEVVLYPDPMLRKRAAPVPAVDDRLRGIAREMVKTMHHRKGIGLAGPQVALLERILVANPTGERGQETVMVNPEILSREGREDGEEGCLSLPGVFGTVRRAAEITVRYLALDGTTATETRSGLSARVVQHEVDHLDGILFIQRISPAERLKVGKRLKELEELHRGGAAARR